MKQKLINVEAGRGIAAMLVVLYHIDKYYFGNDKYWSDIAIGNFFRFGNAGVEFFFVLSGFIIAKVHWKDIGIKHNIFPFLKKRFIRLYPFYWIILSATLCLLFAFNNIGEEKNRYISNIISSIFLIGKNPFDGVVFVSWTLFHEIIFYLLFSIVIWNAKFGFALLWAWAISCLVAGMNYVMPFYVLSPINILFLIGIGCAVIVDRWTIPFPTAFTLLGGMLFLGTGISVIQSANPVQTYAQVMGYGIGSALLLVGGIEAERSGYWIVPKFMGILGAASYSIYLSHMIILTFLAKSAVMMGAHHVLNAHVAMIILAVAAIGIGVAVHFIVEIPTLRYSRDFILGRRS